MEPLKDKILALLIQLHPSYQLKEGLEDFRNYSFFFEGCRQPSPLIDFKLLKNKIILSANIITMTVGLTTLMVVYLSLSIWLNKLESYN